MTDDVAAPEGLLRWTQADWENDPRWHLTFDGYEALCGDGIWSNAQERLLDAGPPEPTCAACKDNARKAMGL